jgi:hypothetical protein
MNVVRTQYTLMYNNPELNSKFLFYFVLTLVVTVQMEMKMF